MDLISLSAMIEFMKMEPGHNFIQCILLFMIWLQSRGVRKDVAMLRESLTEVKSVIDKRFEKIEGRVLLLETKQRG